MNHDGVDLPSLYLKTEVSIEVEGCLMPASDVLAMHEATWHVITAWNPGDVRPSREENEAASSELRTRLVAMGLVPVRAVGADPDSDHAEESLAVVGLSDEQARALGAVFGQVAVFRLSAGLQTVLACTESWERSRPI